MWLELTKPITFQKSHSKMWDFFDLHKYSYYLCCMKLTAERGRNIRKEYSEIKEKEICEERGLNQVGGSKTKIDGSNGLSNESIKNISGSSTQVHLTTQKRFIKVLGLNEDSIIFFNTIIQVFNLSLVCC